MTEQHEELQALLREAAEGWLEYTGKDINVLQDAQYSAVMWCATYLWKKGHGAAGAALLAVVPKEYGDKVLAEIT